MLTILLFIAALVSVVLGDWIEAVVILVIVVLNAVLGYIQEFKAEQSMAALKRMAVPKVRVRRDGQMQEISARELVPGDVVILETGNIVPADGRVLQSVNLRVEEAALTGESEPVEKDPALVFETDQALGDRRNMVYSGTIVNYGRGEFVVTETGMQTELGHIATMIQGVVQEQTPLQQRLDKLGKGLAGAALVLVAVIFALGLLRGQSDIKELLLTAVSLAVAAVPEALTAVVTIALSLGAQRMLKRQALIRKLPAVETLGSVTVICSDKTGTLTLNRMTVTALDIANHAFELTQAAGRDGVRAGADGQHPRARRAADPGPAAGRRRALQRRRAVVRREAARPLPRGRRSHRGRAGRGRGLRRHQEGRPRSRLPARGRGAVRLGAQAHDHGASHAADHRRAAGQPRADLGAPRQPGGACRRSSPSPRAPSTAC